MTDFPEAVDVLANPTAATGTAALSHALQHANANDAIEALQRLMVGRPHYNAKGDFGVVADDVTDDTVAMQAFINTVISEHAVGVLPPGRIKITSPLVIPYSSGWTILGAGAELSIIVQATDDTGIFLLAESGDNNWRMADFGFDWAAPQTGNHGAYAIGFANGGPNPDTWGHFGFILERLSFSNGYAGITQTAAAAVSDAVWGYTIRNLYFKPGWRGTTITLRQTMAGQPNCRVENIYQRLDSVPADVTPVMALEGVSGLVLLNVESNLGTSPVEIYLADVQGFQISACRSEQANVSTGAFSGLMTIADSVGSIDGWDVLSMTTDIGPGNFLFGLRVLGATSKVSVNGLLVRDIITASGTFNAIHAPDVAALFLGPAVASSETLMFMFDGTPTKINRWNGLALTFGEDVNLYRSAADVLKTDDKLVVALELEIDGALNHDGAHAGFYGTAPVAKQTGVPVSAAGVHAALVALGLIAP